MITIYYDGKCALCSKEINHYRSIAPNGIFNWQDITQSTEELQKDGIDLVDGLKRLHAKDNNGTIHIGLDAFILLWRQLKNWRALSYIIALPIIRQIANFSYNKFADWRFKKLEHCQIADANNKNA